VRGHLWWLAGLALVVPGVAMLLASRPDPVPADFGWYAYTPLTEGSSVLMWTGWQLAGAGVAVLGLLLLASGLGYRLGRRRSAVD
jgi:hypothetical protein